MERTISSSVDEFEIELSVVGVAPLERAVSVARGAIVQPEHLLCVEGARLEIFSELIGHCGALAHSDLSVLLARLDCFAEGFLMRDVLRPNVAVEAHCHKLPEDAP